MDSVLAIIEQYLRIPAVTGAEDAFLDFLATDFAIDGYDVQRATGIVAIGRKDARLPENPVIVTAHADRNGLIVNENGEAEYAMYYVQKKHGGITMKPNHFANPGKRFVGEALRAYDPKTGKVFARGRGISFHAEPEKGELVVETTFGKLAPGTAIGYEKGIRREKLHFSGQLDNVISIALARQLIAEGLADMLLLTAGEEAGLSAGHIVAYLQGQGITTSKLLTLDTTAYDVEEAFERGWIMLRNKDRYGEFSSQTVSILRKTCDEQGINFEMKDEIIEAQNRHVRESERASLGVTELGRIVSLSKGAINGATVQIPTEHYHTSSERTSLHALRHFYLFVTQALRSLQQE